MAAFVVFWLVCAMLFQGHYFVGLLLPFFFSWTSGAPTENEVTYLPGWSPKPLPSKQVELFSQTQPLENPLLIFVILVFWIRWQQFWWVNANALLACWMWRRSSWRTPPFVVQWGSRGIFSVWVFGGIGSIFGKLNYLCVFLCVNSLLLCPVVIGSVLWIRRVQENWYTTIDI